MKSKRSTKLITITMAVAALAAAGLLCGADWLQPAEAQSGDESVRFVSYASIAFVPGQKVRVNVGNTAETPSGSTIVLTYKVRKLDGLPLFESEGIQVPAKEFRSSEVSRRDLNIEGEPGTGRAQVMVTLTIIAPAGSTPEDYPVSTEVINEETGATHEYGHYMDIGPAAIPKAAIIGFIPGQRLSLSIFNPPDEGSAPVRAQAYIYDSTGRLITRSAEVEVRPDHSQTFAFNREDLPLAGEEVTGRLQVHAVIQVAFMGGSERKLPVWVEIVNNRTGSNATPTYYIGYIKVSDD